MLTCSPCGGSGSIFETARPLRWAECPECQGQGTDRVEAPATIKIHKLKRRKPRGAK